MRNASVAIGDITDEFRYVLPGCRAHGLFPCCVNLVVHDFEMVLYAEKSFHLMMNP